MLNDSGAGLDGTGCGPGLRAHLARTDPVGDADIREHLRVGRHQIAFETLLPRYRDKVYRLCLSILRQPDAAEDAAQDVFVRVWRALPGYNGSAALSTWIYAITRNTSISLLRKRRPQVSLDEPQFGDEDGEGMQIA